MASGAALVLAVLVGAVMGLIGAGGSILTVPILVYVVGVDVVTATAYSLFVVGVTSAVGAASYWRRGLVHGRAAVAFAVPSLTAVFVTRRFLVPAIPAQLGTVAGLAVSKELFILLLFAVIMAASALTMIRPPRRLRDAPADGAGGGPRTRVNVPVAAAEGAVIGVFTGMVGAGGGFAIVPALAVYLRLPMRVAVGTSLTIIAAKSLIGFLGDVSLPVEFDWPLLAAFTALAVAGVLAGSRLARRVPADKLRPAFGWFVLAAAAAILLRETGARFL